MVAISTEHQSLQLEFANDDEIIIQTGGGGGGGEMHLRRYQEPETSDQQNIIIQSEQPISESEVASNDIIINGGESSVEGSQDDFKNNFWLENICKAKSNIGHFATEENETLTSEDYKIKNRSETAKSATESTSSIEIGEKLFVINKNFENQSNDFVSYFTSSIPSNFYNKDHFEEYKILNSAKK